MTGWATNSLVVSVAVEIPRAIVNDQNNESTDRVIWSERIDQLLAIRQLEDDWDGQGTPAPATDVVDSALILALLLRHEGIAAPNLVTQGLSGEVHFDWLPGEGKYVELQVIAPRQAVVYVHAPGRPTRQFNLAETVVEAAA